MRRPVGVDFTFAKENNKNGNSPHITQHKLPAEQFVHSAAAADQLPSQQQCPQQAHEQVLVFEEVSDDGVKQQNEGDSYKEDKNT